MPSVGQQATVQIRTFIFLEISRMQPYIVVCAVLCLGTHTNGKVCIQNRTNRVSLFIMAQENRGV